MAGRCLRLLPILVCLALVILTTCGKDSPTKPKPPEPPPTPPVSPVATRIEITPSSATLNSIGQTVRLTARVFDQNNSAMVGATVIWSSSDVSVAGVNTQGLVTAVKNGTAVITARSGNASATANVTVSQSVGSIAIAPQMATLMSIGATVQLTTTVLDGNGQPVAGVEVTWESSDESVATVSADGLVTAVGNGVARITATSGSASSGIDVTVMQSAGSIVIAPLEATLMSIGETVQLTVAVLDGNGQPVAGAVVRWESSDESVATVSADGLVTAVGNGVARITATSGSASSGIDVTVMQSAGSIVIAPLEATLMSIGTTVQLEATVLDDNGQVVAGAVVTWQSSDELVATVSAQGLVTAVTNGVTRVTATSGSATAGIDVTVMQSAGSIVIAPLEATLMSIGTTVQLEATVLDDNGQVVAGAVVTWQSSDDAVATVSAQGLVTAVSDGSVVITARTDSVSATAKVKVMIPSPDRGPLMALFRSTGGPGWTNNYGWLSSIPVGDWYGVTADNEGRVTEIELENNNLTGSLPHELAELSQLQVLVLSGNTNLVGPLPLRMSELSLEVLHLDGTNLCAPSDTEFQAWLSDIPDTRIDSCVNDPLELEALVALYNQTGGPNWTYNSNWLTNSPLRTWYGIETNARGKVEYLELHNNNLIGQLPGEISQLIDLRGLRLEYNELTGPIPPELGRLDKLWWVFLWNNQLTGSIPPELGKMQGLSTLGLSRNRLSGPIPPELGQLSQIWNLNLDGNDLTGPIPPELGQMIGLDTMSLNGNELSGPIPKEFGELNALRLLWLQDNKLSGAIPAELGQLVELEGLWLNNNRLSGSVPSEMGNMAFLGTLNLSFNRDLTGELPRSFLDLSLSTLELQETQVCVPLDDHFVEWLSGVANSNASYCDDPITGALTALYNRTSGPEWFNSENWLGELPIGDWFGVTIDQNGQVTAIGLEDNNLSGSLPPILSNLIELSTLNLSGNAGLSGSLPRSFLNLNLIELNLAGTQLCIPPDTEFQDWSNEIANSQVTTCESLNPDQEILIALYNDTGGPNWHNRTNWLSNEPLGNWYGVKTDTEGRVTALDLNNNNLSGGLSSELGQLQRLSELLLSNNNLTGSIPPEIGQLSRLRHMSLSGNPFTGTLPSELGQLSNLVVLGLRGNSLEGRIPPELGKLSSLVELWADGNKFTGTIPSELGQAGNLKILVLDNSKLTGRIPPELGQLSNLEHLGLEMNQLNGTIPTEIGDLTRLRRLWLAGNQLSGDLPSELSQLGNLVVLSLQENLLSGSIPPQLGDMARLSYLDLRNNQLSGPIPPELGRLSNLRSLSLDNNWLSAAVPADIGKLGSLTRLSLSHNPDLTGPLPLTLTNLNLEYLSVEGTRLCAPSDDEFSEWIGSIVFSRVPDCVRSEETLVYLTQAIQSPDYPLPLIAGEDALMRIFISSDADEKIDQPPVRAVFYINDIQVETIEIPGQAIPVPGEIDEGSLSASVNAPVPGRIIEPGLEMVVEIDPDGALDQPSPLRERVPMEGRLSVDVVDVPTLGLTIVPLLWEEDPDRSILIEIENLSEVDDLFWQTRDLLPVDDIEIFRRDPVLTSVDPVWKNHVVLLRELEAIYIMDGSNSRYMGVFRTGGGGATTVGGNTLVTGLYGFTIAHELGHTMGLAHAPCGNPARVDGNYPYDEGTTGVWGYDFRQNSLVPPDSYDLMGYCNPRWISDYHFLKALRHRQQNDADPVQMASYVSDRTLLLWGGKDTDGDLVLEPAFIVDASPSLPSTTGPYRISGEDADGNPLFTVDFAMNEFADGEGGSFAFAIPVQSDWRTKLHRISLDGPEGVTSLTGEGDKAMALLRDTSTGQVRGFLREITVTSSGAVSARRSPPEPGLDMVISKGVPDPADW